MSVLEMLSESFPTFCDSWLTYSRKDKKEIYPESYLYIAMLCGKLLHFQYYNLKDFILQK